MHLMIATERIRCSAAKRLRAHSSASASARSAVAYACQARSGSPSSNESDSRAPRRPATSSTSPSRALWSAARRSGESRSSASDGRGPSEGVELPPRVAARGEEQLGAAYGGVQLLLVDGHLPAREEAEHRPLLGRRRALERPDPVADRLPRHARVLAQFRDQRVPASGRPGGLEAGHVAALGVDQDERGLVGRAEALRERASRIADRRPPPAVPPHERTGAVGRVSRVQAEEVEPLPLLRDPTRVGDRLAVADASPRRPDVDHHRLAAQVCEREPLAVEGDTRDRWRLPRARRAARPRRDHDSERESPIRAARDPFARVHGNRRRGGASSPGTRVRISFTSRAPPIKGARRTSDTRRDVLVRLCIGSASPPPSCWASPRRGWPPVRART